MQSAQGYVDGADPFARHRIKETCRIGEHATGDEDAEPHAFEAGDAFMREAGG